MYTYKFFDYTDFIGIPDLKEMYYYFKNQNWLSGIFNYFKKMFDSSDNWKESLDINKCDFTNFALFSKLKYNVPNYKLIYNKHSFYQMLDGNRFILPFVILQNKQTLEDLKQIELNGDLWFFKLSGTNSFGGYDVFPIIADKTLKERVVKAIREMKKYKNYDRMENQSVMLLQKGIANPLLINGFKFDLRVYYLALICDNKASFFVNSHCLVRKASTKYNKNNMDKSTQLTNTTYNSKFTDYSNLVEIFDDKHPYYHLMPQIYDDCAIISKTFVDSFTLNGHNKGACFKLFGVDFIIDDQENVFVLECNILPTIYSTDEDIQKKHLGIERYLFDGFLNNVIENLLQNKLINRNFGHYKCVYAN